MSVDAGGRDRQTTATPMERVTVRVPSDGLEDLESVVDDSDEFPNRSAAIRTAIEELVERETGGESDG